MLFILPEGKKKHFPLSAEGKSQNVPHTGGSLSTSKCKNKKAFMRDAF